MASVGVRLNAQLGAGFWGETAPHFIVEPTDVRRPQGCSQSRSGLASCLALLYAMSRVKHVDAL